jgi:hypothetical protein
MLPPKERLIGAQLDRYIRDKLYWVLHAPRQTGKTTFLQSWMREINAKAEAVSGYVSVEACQGVTGRTEAMILLNKAVCGFAAVSGLPVPELSFEQPELLLYQTMRKWAELVAPKPLVVLFDETDVLEGDALISFLRQLRSGFVERGIAKFPVSIALVGMRDLKDYLVNSKDGTAVSPGSPFNIKEDSAVLGNFSENDISRLFAQRMEETGQEITQDALDYAWEQSRGQPWIVNSLFKRATMRVLSENSRETVNLAHIQEARQQMILARETHLDSLAVRLKNPEIRYVLETIMTGEPDPALTESEGYRVCLDLGLVNKEEGVPMIANPIYRETLARQMSYSAQDAIPAPEWQWEKSDGSLDMDTLLREFQVFWRENSEMWEQKLDYTEAFPHLLLQAFLQRVLNGGGRIEREYAAGRSRMDLFIEYKNSRYIVEVKLVHFYQSPQKVIEQGLGQIAKYRDSRSPSAPAYLVIFDRRPQAKQLSWDKRISWTQEGTITVVWC